MDEVRKNNPVRIKFNDSQIIEGVVIDYLSDRIMITVRQNFVQTAKLLKELDPVNVTIFTPLGIKTMDCHVISGLNLNDCIVIENVPTAQIAQRREFVRIVHDFEFSILTSEMKNIKCKCINISAGGIAFRAEKELQKDEEVTVLFPSNLFERSITCKAKIIGTNSSGRYTAKYTEINQHDEDKIVKFVFKVMTRIVN